MVLVILQKKRLNFNLCDRYQVKFSKICNGFSQLQVYKWQRSHFHQSTQDWLQEMIFKGSFGQFLKGVIF